MNRWRDTRLDPWRGKLKVFEEVLRKEQHGIPDAEEIAIARDERLNAMERLGEAPAQEGLQD